MLPLAACRKVSGVATVRSETEPTGASADLTAAGAARANISDFDLAMRTGNRLDVPRTFNDVVARLEQRTKGSSTFTLIPHGRSIVRAASSASSPRIVGVIRSSQNARFEPGDLEAWSTPIFYGYSKNGDLFEVISFNHGLGRWEVDLSALLIRGMKKVHLAWNVIEIAPERQASKLIGAPAPVPAAAAPAPSAEPEREPAGVS